MRLGQWRMPVINIMSVDKLTTCFSHGSDSLMAGTRGFVTAGMTGSSELRSKAKTVHQGRGKI